MLLLWLCIMIGYVLVVDIDWWLYCVVCVGCDVILFDVFIGMIIVIDVLWDWVGMDLLVW